MSGDLPDGWHEVRLGQITREVSVRNRDAAEIPVLSVTKHNGFVRSSEYFSRAVHSQDTSNYKIVRKGQFAYATIHLEEGSIALLSDFDQGLISPMYTVFESASKQVCSEYLFSALKRFALSGRFEPYSNGGVNRRKSISFTDLKAFRFALPTLAEQQAISDVTNALGDPIAKTSALIEALAEAKYSTMRELLTRGVRRDQAPMKPIPERWVLGRITEGVTHIPSNWDLVRLIKVAKLESGHTPSRDKSEYWGGTIPWLSLGDTDALDSLEIEETAESVTPKGIANSSARILPVDTVVFSRTATVGKASRMKTPIATSQDFANWICGPTLLPAYLVQVFRHMGREWKRLQEGSTHQTIYMPVFKKLQILQPPLSEQRIIAEIGEAFDYRIEQERKSLAVLIQNRAALAQELLSGRLRLPESLIARHRNTTGEAA